MGSALPLPFQMPSLIFVVGTLFTSSFTISFGGPSELSLCSRAYLLHSNDLATLFGQLWRLERTPLEKKAMWRREMECLLSVTDHIVELEPSLQTFSDGSKLEVSQIMASVSDLRMLHLN